MSSDVAEALELLMRIASGEVGARAEPVSGNEQVTALVVGLNMLAEELDHERAQRIEAEMLLADEREFYDLSPALLCSVDAIDLRVVRANRTLANALGLDRAALVGRSVVSLFVERDRATSERALRAAVDDVGASIPELTLDHTGGGLRVTTNVSLSEDRARLRIVWRDVTRERLLESHLLQAQKMHAVGRLSGGIAHDFNNILAVILTSAAFARADLDASSRAYEDLTTIESAAQRAAGLTAQLLSFARQQIVRPQLVEVGALVREVERMLRRLISESIELGVFVHDEPIVVRIDPSQLTQVLVNLVVNARDAVGDGGKILVEVSRIAIDASYADVHLDVTPGDYVLLAVTDNGSGMPQEVLSQIFEPFFTTKEVGHGSGLGLSVCYGVVQHAGGHIYAYSEEGKGTCLKVYLPRVGGSSTPADEPVATRGGSETILLVEDDPQLRRLMTRVLTRVGYRVVAFDNGAEAIAYVTELAAQFDLLVTDVVMPRMGGREVAERLLAQGKIGGVLYISGYTANSIVHHGVLEDETAFLAKPFTPDQLLRAVRGALE